MWVVGLCCDGGVFGCVWVFRSGWVDEMVRDGVGWVLIIVKMYVIFVLVSVMVWFDELVVDWLDWDIFLIMLSFCGL